jgi:hypothetical protein
MNHASTLAIVLVAAIPCRADEALVKEALARPILPSGLTLKETQDHLQPKLPKLPTFAKAEDWDKYADKLRQDVLDKVVLRGEAKQWAKAKCEVKYLDEVQGGDGYSLRKLRYEALPGMWIPAILYVPAKLSGKVPVMLAVNGHDRNGKAADYKQIRCINLAKRGMIVLNVEWFGMGQLRRPGDRHGCMNQLDLCGTSGLAPFYLAMKRGLDVLLEHKNADPKRVAVSGLSGGGWQTIFISSLDTRVTLSNPVAGYSGFKIRLRDHFKDLGDSEQTPCDMATVADYTHLTAMRAPRPTLLTYNAKDNCCFEAGYALPPLLEAARPAFKLHGRVDALRSHVNHVPGDHNYGQENREALYKMVGDFFYPDDKKFSAKEIECKKEIRTAEDLDVELPRDNASFNSLAKALAKPLPRGKGDRKALREVVKAVDREAVGTEVGTKESNGTKATYWKLKLGKKGWTVPATELSRGKPTKVAVLLHDGGRKAAVADAERLLKDGYRVVAIDASSFGEMRIERYDWLFALLVSAVGDRPLGVQAGQVTAAARWAAKRFEIDGVRVTAVGPRTGLVALVAAALDEKAIASLELEGAMKTLKEVIDQDRTVDQMPEAFCFGLLERFDVPQIEGLVGPRPVLRRQAKK